MMPLIPSDGAGPSKGPQGLAVLLIEDSATDALFAREALRGGPDHEFDIVTVTRLADGLEHLSKRHVDVVVLDLNLPDSQGTGTLERLRAAYPAVPLVVLSGNSDLAIAARVLQMGVQDYLVKDVSIGPTLIRSVRFAIERHRFTALLEHHARALQASEAQLRRVIEGNHDAILIVDGGGVVRFANPAAVELLESPAVGRPAADLHVPTTPGETREQEITHADGRRVVVEPRVSSLEWEGHPALIVSLRDVTARRRALEEIEHARARQMQIKDQFLTHISHELRTPLTVVYEFLSILGDGIAGRLNDEQAEYVAIMLRNVDELNHMIEDLLEVTRAHRGKLSVEPRILGIEQTLAETADDLARVAANKNIRLEHEVASDLPTVLADPLRLVQVLDNLIGNAIKFTPSGGHILVKARRLGDEVEVVVSDTGPGLAPDEAAHVFEELYQAAKVVDEGRKGLGLGLYICKQLVTRHGGRIWVESQPGVGSAFHFTLPVYSLSARLQPLLEHRDPAHDRVWSLVLEVRARTGSPFSSGQEMALRRLYEQLQESLPAERCVLLPRKARKQARHESLHIVGCCDEVTAKSIEVQLQERLHRNAELHASGLSFELSPQRLEGVEGPTLATGPDADTSGIVQRVEDWIAKAA